MFGEVTEEEKRRAKYAHAAAASTQAAKQENIDRAIKKAVKTVNNKYHGNVNAAKAVEEAARVENQKRLERIEDKKMQEAIEKGREAMAKAHTEEARKAALSHAAAASTAAAQTENWDRAAQIAEKQIAQIQQENAVAQQALDVYEKKNYTPYILVGALVLAYLVLKKKKRG